MTMIICAVAVDQVVMVSDRRATNPTKIGSEIENKAVVLNNQWVLGYTGLVDIEGTPTDRWVVEALAGVAPEDYFRTLAARATNALMGVERKDRRQAFLVAGWLTPPEGARPIAVEIANFNYDDQGRPTAAGDRLTIRKLNTPPEEVSVFSAGRRLRRAEKSSVETTLREISRTSAHPLDIAAVLGDRIRDRARSDRGVGSNLMVVSIPKVAVGRPLSWVSQREAWRQEICAAYVGVDDDCFQYMPALVLPGVAFSDAWMSSDPTSYPLGPLERRPLPLRDGGIPPRPGGA